MCASDVDNMFLIDELSLNSSDALSKSLANPRQITRSPSPQPSPQGRGSFLPSPWGRRAGDEGRGVTLPSATEESGLRRAREMRVVQQAETDDDLKR